MGSFTEQDSYGLKLAPRISVHFIFFNQFVMSITVFNKVMANTTIVGDLALTV